MKKKIDGPFPTTCFTPDKMPRCAFSTCKKRITPAQAVMVCAACKGAFCTLHRAMEDHACPEMKAHAEERKKVLDEELCLKKAEVGSAWCKSQRGWKRVLNKLIHFF